MVHEAMRKVQEKNPTWKLNIKHENERNRVNYQNKSYQQPHQPMHYGHNMPPMNNHIYNQMPPRMPYNNPYQQQQTQKSSELIFGQKPCNILVRQLWLGGIPENFDKMYMHQIMSQFGIIEDIEIFPKFAFVKYKLVNEATQAFERAEQIHQMLGSPSGFRVFFSDPSRRAHIVSNNYQFDRTSVFLPILFLGFPPITSANVDLEHMKSICERYGPILSQYMRKNSNTQNRSYILFTYDNVKNALRAKQELSKRRDLLGDKRVEVTLLLDETIILKGKDLSFTEKMYQSDMGGADKNKRMAPSNGYYGMHNMKQPPMMPMQPMGYPMYPPNIYGQHYMPPPYYQDQQMYYDIPNQYPPFTKNNEEGQLYHNGNQKQQENQDQSNNIHQLLQNFISDPFVQNTNQKKPVKTHESGNQQDILSKLLGTQAKVLSKNQQNPHKDDREPSWSGFLTWKGVKRVAVDGHSNTVEPEDYAINILSLIQFKDIVLKEKNVMVLEPSNNISTPVFKEYIKNLQQKVGVSMNSQYLMYVMSKSKNSDQIQPINQNQLLVVLQKASFLTQIKDKLLKCEQVP